MWAVVAPVPLPPSPKSHAKEVSVLPLGALEPEPLKARDWFAFPRYGPPGFATGEPVLLAVPPPHDMAVSIKMTDRMNGMEREELLRDARRTMLSFNRNLEVYMRM